MRAHHLRRLARQSAEHRSRDIRRTHLVTNVLGTFFLLTAASQVALGPTDLGTVLVVAAGLYMAVLDPLAAALVVAATLAWARIPYVPWGPGHGWLAGVVVPLAAFAGIGCVALAAHTYHHEHAPWLANEPRRTKLGDTLHVIAFGAFQFAVLALLDRGWRPRLGRALADAERALSLRRERNVWANWGGTCACAPAVTWLPETADDVVRAVREARAAGRRVRVVGSGFTWASFVPTDDVLLFSERLDALDLDTRDPARPLLVAGAGATNRQTNTFLSARGLCLPWNVVLETVRIGGTVSTGTHGSGRDTATMGDLLEAVELVDGEGNLRRFDRRDGEDVLAALSLSLGTFGVLTRVWLRTMPLTAVRQRDRKVPLAEALASMEALVERHDAVELYWFPFCDWAWVRTVDRTDAPVTARPLASRAIQLENLVQLQLLKLGTRAVHRFAERAVPSWIRFSTAWLRWREVVVPYPDSQHYRQWIESLRVGCVEAAFPVGEGFANVHAAWAILQERVDAWRREGKHPLDLTVNVRFTGPSGALLSPAYGVERTCWIEALCVERTPAWGPCSADLLGRWMALPGAFTHLAKEFEHVPGLVDTVRERYGDRIDRFHAARDAAGVDPDGMFTNPLLTTLLAPRAARRAVGG